jgi:hypothetical protein
VARKNIEFLELQNEIKELRGQLQLAARKAEVAEEMTESVRGLSEEMLGVYRDNFAKMSDFLKQAEKKETELLQSNRLLSDEMQVTPPLRRRSRWSSTSTRRTSRRSPPSSTARRVSGNACRRSTLPNSNWPSSSSSNITASRAKPTDHSSLILSITAIP